MTSRIFATGIMIFGLAFAFPGTSGATPCDAVKREMAYGQAASEDAKDETGFEHAAKEFQKAANKAPNCAAAFFNLGVVEEKAGALAAAKSAFERYLKLAPKAPDASSVEQLIYKLEYRITRAGQPKSRWARLNGKWCSPGSVYLNSCPDTTIVVRGNTIEIHMAEAFCFISTIASSGRIQGDYVRDGGQLCSQRAGEKLGTFGGQILDSGSKIKMNMIIEGGVRLNNDLVRWN